MADLAGLDDVIASLREATVGDRELDADIALVVVRQTHPEAHFADKERGVIQVAPGLTTGASEEVPHFTTSADDAMSLFPNGPKAACFSWDETGFDGSVLDFNIQAATVPLAFCIAALECMVAKLVASQGENQTPEGQE